MSKLWFLALWQNCSAYFVRQFLWFLWGNKRMYFSYSPGPSKFKWFRLGTCSIWQLHTYLLLSKLLYKGFMPLIYWFQFETVNYWHVTMCSNRFWMCILILNFLSLYTNDPFLQIFTLYFIYRLDRVAILEHVYKIMWSRYVWYLQNFNNWFCFRKEKKK